MRIQLDRDRFVETMQEQAENGGLHWLALSNEDEPIRDWFYERMEAAGLEVFVDEFGNMFGRRKGTAPNAATVVGLAVI